VQDHCLKSNQILTYIRASKAQDKLKDLVEDVKKGQPEVNTLDQKKSCTQRLLQIRLWRSSDSEGHVRLGLSISPVRSGSAPRIPICLKPMTQKTKPSPTMRENRYIGWRVRRVTGSTGGLNRLYKSNMLSMIFFAEAYKQRNLYRWRNKLCWWKLHPSWLWFSNYCYMASIFGGWLLHSISQR